MLGGHHGKHASTVLTTLHVRDNVELFMPPVSPAAPMTAEEIVALTKRHTLFEWSAQQHVDPIPVSHAKGSYF